MERTQDSILYIETDIRPGMTVVDWRRARAPHSARRRFMGRLRPRRAPKTH